MTLRKTVLGVAIAAMFAAALTTPALARSFSINGQTLRATFFEIRFAGAFGIISCPTTLEGSFHSRTLAKVAGSLVGYITSVSLGRCISGRATILRETLPWHMRYASFSGTLPNITSINATVTGAAFRVQEPFAGCLAVSTAEAPLNFTFSVAFSEYLEPGTLGGTIPTSCGLNGTVSSSFARLTWLNSINPIFVRLI
ncbi:MAG TPA: hypothetical protein VFS37_10565 [Conexibacter sp.]|nr:hypothetical protein [Conexibacter sp.]